jgi:hypothetical protein
MPTTWTEVGDHAAGLVRALAPESPIFAAVGTVFAMSGRGADFWQRRTATRTARTRPEHDVLDAQIAWLRRRTTASAPSRYLSEEGHPTDDTDCFNCASAHLAAWAGSLQQAATAAERAGTCDATCTRWWTLAQQEPGILLEHDWPADKTWPADQQAVIDHFRPQVAELWAAGWSGDTTTGAVLLAQAAAGLKEATRFTRSGDPVTHPEVERRRLAAEQALASAERLDVTAWDAKTSKALRRLRQQVSGGIVDNTTLVQAAAAADTLAVQVSATQAAQLTPAQLRTWADQAQTLHQQLAAARRDAAPRVLARRLFEDVDTRIPHELVESLADVTSPTTPDANVRPFLGATPATEQAITNLLKLEAARGVPVRIEELPTVIEDGEYAGQVLGAYIPRENAILLGPQLWSEDAGDVNTTMEEVAHSLLHNRSCDIYHPAPGTPYEDIPEEREAKAAVLLALLATGLPVETDTGAVIPPRELAQDVQHDLAGMDPLMRHRAHWAAAILTQAVQGDITGAAQAAVACPRTLTNPEKGVTRQ